MVLKARCGLVAVEQELVSATARDGLWHETYFIRGGMEAIYGDVPPPLGLTAFAPIRPATGAGFSSRSRLKVTGEQTVSPPIAGVDFPRREIPPKTGP
jgi:hypothetical protein